MHTRDEYGDGWLDGFWEIRTTCSGGRHVAGGPIEGHQKGYSSQFDFPSYHFGAFGSLGPAVSSCVACAPGTADTDKGPATPCARCGAGRFSSATGATTCDSLCPTGTYAPPGSTAAADCVRCAPGTIDADSNSSTPCEACPSGRYSTELGATACAGLCRPGSYAAPGSRSSAGCVDCVAGKRDADSNPATPCHLCPRGRYSNGLGNRTLCSGICPQGSPHGSRSADECMYQLQPPLDRTRASAQYAHKRVENSATVATGGSMHTAVGFLDVDNNIDMYISHTTGSNKLFRGDGAGGMAEVTAGPAVNSGGTTRHSLFFDANGDGHQDIYASNRGAKNNLFINQGDGEFTSVLVGPAVTFMGGLTGETYQTVAGDLSCPPDGHQDLYVSNRGAKNQLLINDGSGIFADVTDSLVVATAGPTYHSIIADFDSDGCNDLYVTNYFQVNQLFLNARGGPGAFVQVTNNSAVSGEARSRMTAEGDLDQDGKKTHNSTTSRQFMTALLPFEPSYCVFRTHRPIRGQPRTGVSPETPYQHASLGDFHELVR